MNLVTRKFKTEQQMCFDGLRRLKSRLAAGISRAPLQPFSLKFFWLRLSAVGPSLVGFPQTRPLPACSGCADGVGLATSVEELRVRIRGARLDGDWG
eukprot:5047977-Amphidinium_carterae.1